MRRRVLRAATPGIYLSIRISIYIHKSMESPAGTRSSLESPDISTASALRGLPAHDIGANNGMSQLLGGVVAEGSQSGGEHAADSDGGINGEPLLCNACALPGVRPLLIF